MSRFLKALIAVMISATPALADFVIFNQDRFEAAVASKGLVVVHTHESWCPVCRVQAQVLENLQKDPSFSKLVVFRAHPATDRVALEKLKAPARSIIVLFANGKESGRLNSVTDADSIRLLLETASD